MNAILIALALSIQPQPAPQTASATVAEFKAANRPKMVDGRPSESQLDAKARETWCGRLMPLAREHLARPGDKVTADRCAVTLQPAPERQVVKDVNLRFDGEFFFKKPYAAASYDRNTRTLYLPLASLETAWDQVGATRHEWLHARIHERARSGDALSAALFSVVSGPAFKPDAFHIDELAVGICDVMRALESGKQPQAWQLQMAKGYLEALRTEVRAMKGRTGGETETRAGVPGTRFASDGTVSWVGGKDLPRSLALLEGTLNDTEKAMGLLTAAKPDVASARSLSTFSSGVCETSSPRS
jgi:hypothetical protein